MRPKEFNRNSVLEKCIVLFWKEGFNGTGIQKVVEATKVNRFSLYNEFGNKDGILVASLELYTQRHIPWQVLSGSGSLEDVLIQFYTSFFRPTATSKHPVGCYISTMAMELRETDIMQSFFNSFLDTLLSKFTRLVQSKSNSSELDTHTVAKNLTMFYSISMGMYVIFTEEEAERYIRNNVNLITKCLSK